MIWEFNLGRDMPNQTYTNWVNKVLRKPTKAGNYVSKKKYLLILESASEDNVTPHQHQLLAGS